MKNRILSFMAIAAIICAFTGCGGEKSEENKNSSKLETTTVLEEITTTEKNINDEVTTTNINSVEGTSNDSSNELTAEELNSTASVLSKTENMALVEMLDIGKLPMPGYAFIISSDADKNYNVPDDFDVDDFEKRTNEYLEIDLNGLEWFSIICEDQSIFSAVVIQKQPDIVGVGPKTILPSNYGQEVYNALIAEVTDDMPFDKVYDNCKSIITKNN